jgi:hypothetical protein
LKTLSRESCIGLTIAEFRRRNLSERIDWTDHWPVIERRAALRGRRCGWRIVGVYDSESLTREGCVPVYVSHNGRRVTIADDDMHGMDWFATAAAWSLENTARTLAKPDTVRIQLNRDDAERLITALEDAAENAEEQAEDALNDDASSMWAEDSEYLVRLARQIRVAIGGAE